MLVSDFNNAESTQQLLYTLFCSEIGLFSVAHPSVQMCAVRDVFKTLQKNIVANLQAGKETFEMSVGKKDNVENIVLSWHTDAQLFQTVYKGLNLVSEMDDAAVLNARIYPLLKDMVLGNAALKSHTTKLLQGHIERYGKHVGERIVHQLSVFKLGSLAENLMPVVFNANPTP